jgi:hypothetical protein
VTELKWTLAGFWTVKRAGSDFMMPVIE